MESFVDTTCQLGRALAFGTALIEPIVAAPLPGATTLQAYMAMNAAVQRPYDTVYKDLIATIIVVLGHGWHRTK